MVSGPGLRLSSLAALIAATRPPTSPAATSKVAGARRSSRLSRHGRNRAGALRRVRGTWVVNSLLIQERVNMGSLLSEKAVTRRDKGTATLARTVSARPAIGRTRGWSVTALRPSADDRPQLVVGQEADDPARITVGAALALENLDGEQLQPQELSQRMNRLLIKDDRVHDLPGVGRDRGLT